MWESTPPANGILTTKPGGPYTARRESPPPPASEVHRKSVALVTSHAKVVKRGSVSRYAEVFDILPKEVLRPSILDVLGVGRRGRAMGEVHSHNFRPVGQFWVRGEEHELCCECGEKLWIIFEDSHSPHRGLTDRFRRRFDRFNRLNTA